MGEAQIWQAEGLGADRGTLEAVIRVFESDGVQGEGSCKALKRYIRKLDDDKLGEMCEISRETALQLFDDCFGVAFAAEKYSRWQNKCFEKAIDILQTEKKTAKQEAEEIRRELSKVREKLNEEIDRLNHDCSIKNYEKEEADQKVKELQNTLAHYKADLYDFYAREGKVPNYE